VRLVVLSDITSLTPTEGEPDDGQSLIRLMLYANDFDIEGLIATASLRHNQGAVRPDLMRQVVAAYEQVRPSLVRHDPRYPEPEALRRVIFSGQGNADPKVPVEASVGEGLETEGSKALIAIVDRDDPRPVDVVIWGGSADLAQALWTVRKTRNAEEQARFLSKLRIRAIVDQDSTGPWIRREFPTLAYTFLARSFRGLYRGGDQTLVGSDWVAAHLHGHGALGELYPDYNRGDIWTARLGPVRGTKEGDTPSFLGLIPNGLTDLDHPDLATWGGRTEPAPGRGATVWLDVPDLDQMDPADPDPRMASVSRWRRDFQADFQARMDWCVKPVSDANHPPTVYVAGDRVRRVRPGDVVLLDASASSDPDGNSLRLEWMVDPSVGAGGVVIDGRDQAVAKLAVPVEWPEGRTLPVIVRVTDAGEPGLTRYGRVWVEVVGASE
jgi:hypothetical protein